MKNNLPISEDSLIRGLQAKNNKAYAVLYDGYSVSIFGIIKKIVRDEAEAENLLQDTFVKIWKNIDQYDSSKGRLFTWILNIARNTAINFTNSKHFFEPGTIQNLDYLVYTDTRSIFPEESNYIGVNETVQELDSKLKQMIEMIYYLGYTQQEVADELKLPLGTVKTRTRTALQLLREKFGNE